MVTKIINWIILLALLLLLPVNYLSAQPGGEGVVIGKSYSLKSDIFNEERTVLVYLPASYRTSNEKYPVLYVLDGYDHFHYVSGVVLTLSRSCKIPEMIVVGIYNPHRNRDFTPIPFEEKPNSGTKDKFLKFAEKELFPFIEDNLRTQSCRLLIGHSLCGMFSIYTMLNYPKIFKGIIAVSPGAWINDNFLIKFTKQSLKINSDLNNILYFSVGGSEHKDDIESVLELKRVFETTDHPGLDWKFEFREGEDHFSVVDISIYNGLCFVFSDMMATDKLSFDTTDKITSHYEKLSNKYGYKIKIPERFLNSAGYDYLKKGEIFSSIDAFKKNLEQYPNSANAYNSLAEAYEANNQIEEALKHYKKAVEIANKNRDPNLYYFMQDYENIRKKIFNR
ncbi:alpha/beta hydrolase-fold protein [Bacteroidota bacterium]